MLFDEDFSPLNVYEIPVAAVKRHAKYREHVHGHVLRISPALVSDPDVRDITRLFLQNAHANGS